LDERKRLNTGPADKPSDAYRAIGDAFAIDQNQSLLRQQTAQVKLNGAITAIANVQVDGSACFLRNEFLQVRSVADTEFLDVLRTICVHWIGAGLFRIGNVRPGHHHAVSLNWTRGRSWERLLKKSVRVKK